MQSASPVIPSVLNVQDDVFFWCGVLARKENHWSDISECLSSDSMSICPLKVHHVLSTSRQNSKHHMIVVGEDINSLMLALFWQWLLGLFTPVDKRLPLTIEKDLEITRASAHQYLYDKGVLWMDSVSHALNRDQIYMKHSWGEAAVKVHKDSWFLSRGRGPIYSTLRADENMSTALLENTTCYLTLFCFVNIWN